MNTTRLETLQSEIVRNTLLSKDSAHLEKVLDLLRRKEKTFERIPGWPYTEEDRTESLKRGMKDIEAGRVVSMEHMRAMYPRPDCKALL